MWRLLVLEKLLILHWHLVRLVRILLLIEEHAVVSIQLLLQAVHLTLTAWLSWSHVHALELTRHLLDFA